MLLTDYAPGQPYADDLVRIRDTGDCSVHDFARAAALARYLAGIHHVLRHDPLLWRRRLRDLIGHGEGIMGLADSYPPHVALISANELRAIEDAANRWRWQLKPLDYRLCQVHGDFHPYNVLFEDDDTFIVIDRSRGAWGEAADDVSCMAINYLFFSLQRCGTLEGPFEELYRTFFNTYLDGGGGGAQARGWCGRTEGRHADRRHRQPPRVSRPGGMLSRAFGKCMYAARRRSARHAIQKGSIDAQPNTTRRACRELVQPTSRHSSPMSRLIPNTAHRLRALLGCGSISVRVCWLPAYRRSRTARPPRCRTILLDDSRAESSAGGYCVTGCDGHHL